MTFAISLGSIPVILVILVGYELVTNGVEWLGRRFKRGLGFLGSILAVAGPRYR